MKKGISVLLACIMLLGCFCMPGAVAATAAQTPTIYIVGGNQVMIDPETGEQKWEITVPEGYIEAAVQDCAGDLLKAGLSGSEADLDAYRTKLLSWVAPLYADVRCDNNGVPLHELNVCMDYNPNRPFIMGESVDDRIYNGYYPLHAYDFYYDWRADLFIAAQELAKYIGMIREATGSEKVNLVGRCEGASVILAYLAEYGSDQINRILFYTPTSEEYMLVSQSYSGKIRFSLAQITTWLDNNRYLTLDTLPVGSELIAFLDAGMRLAAKSPLGLSDAMLNSIFDRVFRSVLPDVLLATYANMPATWSMVSDEDFEDAMRFVFDGREAQYAGLTARIRRYHDTVGVRSEDLLQAAAENGVHIGVVTKYGYPAIPLFEESAMLSDSTSLVKYTSLGATCADHYDTLPESYITAREKAGKGAYLSPDRKIDASTCMFPDSTWFVGGIDHDNFPWCVDLFIERFMLSETPMTVTSDENRPHYLLYDNNDIIPMTAENADRSVAGSPEQSQDGNTLYRFVRSFADILIKIINALRDIIGGFIAHGKGTAAQPET